MSDTPNHTTGKTLPQHFITIYSGTGTFMLLSRDKLVEIPLYDERTANEVRDELNEYVEKQLSASKRRDATLLINIEALAVANEQAAIRSPQDAAWSNGVASGLRTAAKLLRNETLNEAQSFINTNKTNK